MTERNSEAAIKKLRRLSMLPKGTHVLARQHFRGVIDGQTTNGDYIVLFDTPVCFPSINMKVYRGSFPVGEVQEIE